MWKCNKCGAENEENTPICKECQEPMEASIDIDDAEAEAVFEVNPKKRRKRIIALVLAAIVAIGVVAVIFMSMGKPDKSLPSTYKKLIKSNPEITETGVAFEVNGMAVDEVAWNYYFMSTATSYANGLGMTIDGVDWDKKDDKGETALERVKYDAMKNIISNASAVSLAEEWGIELTKEELNIIDVDLDYWKQVYGDDVYKKLHMGSEADYRKIYDDILLWRKVTETVSENPDKYLKGVKLENYANNQSATVKIMGVNKGEDESQAARAKTKVEEMKKRLDAGERFDDIWLESYEETTGITEEKPIIETIYKDGTTDKAIEKAALKLKIGETSGIVETDYSYAIITRVAGYTEVENYIAAESDVNINKKLIESSVVK